jgi:mannose/cellobiose epimerase-like protein (N-acyl-D-glucosamine 2-epimerase family)
VGRDDRNAIGVSVGRIAKELGDQADTKVSISRALNLYQTSGVGLDGFVDLLYRSKGEVVDRRNFPGKAPIPRNRMAYFFAVVEDRLGLREPSASGST